MYLNSYMYIQRFAEKSLAKNSLTFPNVKPSNYFLRQTFPTFLSLSTYYDPIFPNRLDPLTDSGEGKNK